MKVKHKPFEERFDIKVKIGHPSALENTVRSIFEEALKKIDNSQDYRLLNNVWLNTTSGTRFELDLLLLYKEAPLAIIEVKRRLEDFTIKSTSRFGQYCKILGSGFCFVCDCENFILFKDEDGLNEISHEKLIPDNVSQAITGTLHSIENNFENLSDDDVRSVFKRIISESQIDEKAKDDLKDIIASACFVSFDNSTFIIDESTERHFFLKLLGDTANKVCRYTSVPSIYRTINDKEQSMCSIVCMNDTSELHYAASLIGYEALEFRREGNSCYILSCADKRKKDDLTMWRLYGDDGRGVNIEYDVDKHFIDSYSSFSMAPVSYADKYGVDRRLDLIKNLLGVTIGGAKLSLSQWGIWQHFFKPYEYHDEAEIRLLFWNQCDLNDAEEHAEEPGNYPTFKRKWIFESTYEVVAPIACFKIAPAPSNFPLR
ncbi:MAG: DUF2971 domain-containing protein, partial [Muribaculum sp.]|nr:DUF2971 domain-containing protein [Muribaculum sp.]